jgi:hypothetical protein
MAGLERHALDLAVLGAAALVTALRPRLAPYLAVLAILFQSGATHWLTSDGLVLAGACAGLAFDRARRRDWPSAADVPAALMALLALDGLALASLLANWDGQGHAVALPATEYFVSRTVLVAALVLLAPRPPDALLPWLRAGAVGALAAGSARLLELAALPVQPLAAALSIHLLGDLTDVGSWNVFAVTMVAGGLMALAAAVVGHASRAALAGWSAVSVVVLMAGATAQSRTATLIVVLLFAGLIAAARGVARRAALAVLPLAFVAAALLPGSSVLDKPVLVQDAVPTGGTPAPSPGTAATPAPTGAAVPQASGVMATAPPFAAPRGLGADWRAVLDQPYYSVVQEIHRPQVAVRGNHVDILVRAGVHTPDVRLRVAIDGRTVAEVGTDRIGSDYGWIVVPIPDGLLTPGRDVAVDLTPVGALDSQSRYISVGGVYGYAPGLTSDALSAGRPVHGDLSADAGAQTGTFLVLLDGELPPLTRFQPPHQAVLDPSLSDRFALWRTAWRVWLGHPLLGTGFYTFGTVQHAYTAAATFAVYDNAHDNFFELLADLGILGPVLLLLVMASAALPLALAAGRARRWEHLALLAVVAVALLSSLTQTWIADSRVAMYFWVSLLVVATAGGPLRNRRWYRPAVGTGLVRRAARALARQG